MCSLWLDVQGTSTGGRHRGRLGFSETPERNYNFPTALIPHATTRLPTFRQAHFFSPSHCMGFTEHLFLGAYDSC